MKPQSTKDRLREMIKTRPASATIPLHAETPAAHEPPPPPVAPAPTPAKPVRLTFAVPEDLAREVRAAVAVLGGDPCYYTVTSFGEQAFRQLLAELRREHNDGKPFVSSRRVRAGRPVKAP